MSKLFLPNRTEFRYLTREPQPLLKTDPVQVTTVRSGPTIASFLELEIAMYPAFEFVKWVWRTLCVCVGMAGLDAEGGFSCKIDFMPVSGGASNVLPKRCKERLPVPETCEVFPFVLPTHQNLHEN
jgi:hypothetical protein